MKKILLLTILGLILSLSESKSQNRRYSSDDVQVSPVVLGVISGGAFILMGALQQPDEKWIESSSGTFYNKNQKGYWRNETFWEDRNRVAAVLSGVAIIGFSITITLK